MESNNSLIYEDKFDVANPNHCTDIQYNKNILNIRYLKIIHLYF